jgi:superoxide dismutase, Fe-Mn family
MELTKREALTMAVAGSAALMTLGGWARAEEAPQGPAGAGVQPGKHTPVPLAFDPKKLGGLSERLIVSHHENNYGGAIRNLNAVELEVARITKQTPGYQVGGLKERELAFTNSVILHELYFGNLGGEGKASGAIQKALADAHQGFGRFEELFRATGLSLSGGSGWAILDLCFHTGALRTYWSSNHTQSVAFGAPLLVMDMYEHAYQMDYGAAAAKYVDAFLANVRWDEVDRRYARALRASQALRAPAG